MSIRIAIAGFGKIGRDEHLPAIRDTAAFDIVALVTRSGTGEAGLPGFASIEELVAADVADAVAVCTPPEARFALALAAIDAGLHVLLEKPPAATLGEVDALIAAATTRGTALYAAWHSQHAPAVAPARAALAGERVTELRIEWLEDVRKFHPGQEWVWQAGGFGTFDSGINALSIAAAILPQPLLVADARLEVPANRQAPIAARLRFAGLDGGARFDWGTHGAEEWSITAVTARGRRVELHHGGGELWLDGVQQALPERREYPPIYARFADLVATRTVEVDREPLRIVADAFLVGERVAVAPFAWD